MQIVVIIQQMYRTNRDLPIAVKDNLPSHAQDIYRESFNSAMEQYKDESKKRDPKEDTETIAHQIAWSAVKRKYRKDDKTGRWKEK